MLDVATNERPDAWQVMGGGLRRLQKCSEMRAWRQAGSPPGRKRLRLIPERLAMVLHPGRVELSATPVTLFMHCGKGRVCRHIRSLSYRTQGLSNSAGFSLVEVIVAMAILSLALGVLLNVIGNGLRNTGQAERAATAASLAQSLLAEVGIGRPARQGLSSGEFGGGYRWQLTIQQFGDATERQLWPVGAYTIVAEVLWSDGERERSYRLTTLRLGPKEPPR